MIAAWPFGDLTPGKYGAILADPPWPTEMRSPRGQARCPERHYATMTEAEIAALPVSQLAGPDCALILWATWHHLPMALRVMAAWGFAFRTGGSWVKTTASGAPAMGLGYILRCSEEPYLVGTIGAPRWRSRSERQTILAPRREHSRKPPEMRAMVRRLLPDVWHAELFGREPWPGADVWGNEPGRFA